MYVSYGIPVVAKQMTGHPAALPADPPAGGRDTQVAPVSDQQGTGASQLGLGGEELSAPPSALQRKIMEILERQARDLEQS